ncbi:MAG TPA: c-type cytochrome [Bryobacteraceae bacterium]|nr:c-type cytochrome [Bryobacteraceae bacterium]
MKVISGHPRIGRTALLLFCSVTGILLYADPVSHGKEIFDKKCTKCHDLDKDKEGPRLRGVFGRRAAAVQSFQYSDSLKDAKITWDETSLNTWLIDPDRMVPDNDMAFHLDNAGERRDVVAYLKSLSAK